MTSFKKDTQRDIPNPSLIGRWISGEPMAREREINPQYQKNYTK